MHPSASLVVLQAGIATMAAPPSRAAAPPQNPGQPIIGGNGNGTLRYEYLPDRLRPPRGAAMVNCHGFALDADHNIYLAYENDGGKTDSRCLVKWRPDGTRAEFVTVGNNGNDGDVDGVGGDTSTLCSGTPHGLTIATETNSVQYLYHANNDAKLTKTHLNGTVVWQTIGNFGQNPALPYKPTWFAVPPSGPYIYLCDGYGSNDIYVLNRADGTFLHRTYGGKGGRSQHGKFDTNHGCTYDPRYGQIVVADRANGRLEYFDHGDGNGRRSDDGNDNGDDGDLRPSFVYSHTVDLRASSLLGESTLPCILRPTHDGTARAVVPDLAGSVAILDGRNDVMSVINVSALLGRWGHRHPHDAQVLPNGDLVVATWNPGRLSYWRMLPSESASVSET